MAPSRCCAKRVGCFPLSRIIGDAGYQGPKMAAARTGACIGWISRNRCLAHDCERYCHTAAAFVRMAVIRIMLRRHIAYTRDRPQIKQAPLCERGILALR